MGLSDFFSKDARSVRALRKQIQRATDKRAQSPDRWKALETLRDDGSPEAILGLLRRFSFVYDKSIEDEQEKEWVYQTLLDLGARILPELRRYMLATETLAWPLKVLEGLTSGDEFRAVLRELCERNDNSYVRDPTKKIQLVHFLGEHRDPVLAQLLVPYLEDVDEGVRFKAVEALLHQRNQEVALQPLLNLLLQPSEESRRIKIRIVEGLGALGWPLGERAAAVAPVLPDLVPGARLDAQKKIKLPE